MVTFSIVVDEPVNLPLARVDLIKLAFRATSEREFLHVLASRHGRKAEKVTMQG